MFLSASKEQQIKDIQAKTGLDFKIHKVPMDMKWGKGGHKSSPYYALVNSKSGKILNSVMKGYHVTQNEDIIGLVLDGIAPFGSELSVQFGGSIADGKKVFLQLAIEGDGKVDGDTIKRYITIIDSNDGSTGLSVGIGDLTMSCQNQFFKFYKAGQSRYKHTASMKQRLLELPSLIESALAESLRLMEQYNTFASNEVSRELAHKMVNYLLGYDKQTMTHIQYAELGTKAQNNMENLYNHIEKEMNQKGNTLWGLHSGVTSWTTHEKQAPKRDNGRIESSMTGTNYKVNQASLEFVQNEAGIYLPA